MRVAQGVRKGLPALNEKLVAKYGLTLEDFENGVGARGTSEPPSTHIAGADATEIVPLAALKTSACSGSAALHAAVVTGAPTASAAAARHVAGFCSDVIDDADTFQFSLSREPTPQGHVYTSAPGFVSKSAMSMHMGVPPAELAR